MPKPIQYEALRVVQVQGGKPLILFSAPALEIERWAGVPQKKGGEGQEETVGFQRDEDARRVDAISEFLRDPANVVQNPLLCAVRTTSAGSIEFVPHDQNVDLTAAGVVTGTLRIEVRDLAELPLQQLIEGVMQQIEVRLPNLTNESPDPAMVAAVCAELREQSDETAGEQEDDGQSGDSEDVGEEAMTAFFSDETHVVDFWRELAARNAAIQQLADFNGDDAAGYSREALAAFLKPVVVVDGQHRLRGAVEAARSRMHEDGLREEAERLVDAGDSRDEVDAKVRAKADRLIPVSLVWSDDPAEHVFQFVVVNQKATPIHKALLGTILSTTLTKEETEQVRERLEGAGIKLQQAQNVAFMTRNPNSPFYGKIETGMVGEGGNKLAWSVMQSLIRIFQELKGGTLFHQTCRDYANWWRINQLEESGIVAGWEDRGSGSAYEDWSRPDGPWRDVFIAFYKKVRDFFSNQTDADARNYWGDPKSSNLFNKISLTILAADFFQFLNEKGRSIDAIDDVERLVNEWLINVKRDYFTGEWPLQGKKKDSPGIRKRWADLWEGYRKSPDKNLPQRRMFGQPM